MFKKANKAVFVTNNTNKLLNFLVQQATLPVKTKIAYQIIIKIVFKKFSTKKIEFGFGFSNFEVQIYKYLVISSEFNNLFYLNNS